MRVTILFVLLMLLGAGIQPFSATAAPNADIVVDSLADEMENDGNCTLREAVEAANTNTAVDACPAGSLIQQDTIIFSIDGTILLDDVLYITEGVELRGNGQDKTILDGQETPLTTALLQISGISGRADVTVGHLTIQNGNNISAAGGAISYNAEDPLTLDRVTLRFNKAGGGAGLSVVSDVTIRNSRFFSNTVTGGGGAFRINNGTATIEQSTFERNISGGAGGGALYALDRVLNIDQSTFSHNRAQSDLGTGGAIDLASSSATVTNSTIADNYAGSSGGGLRIYDGQATLVNSTISGNSASVGGGFSIETDSTLEVRHSTITLNAPRGVRLSSATAVFQDVLIGNNDLTNCSLQFGSTIQSLGHNLTDFNTCNFDQATDRVVGEALFQNTLGPLQDNGGPTQTHALLPGNPAIDGGSCSGVTADQRGVARPQGQACDIGAYEHDGNLSVVYLPLLLR